MRSNGPLSVPVALLSALSLVADPRGGGHRGAATETGQEKVKLIPGEINEKMFCSLVVLSPQLVAGEVVLWEGLLRRRLLFWHWGGNETVVEDGPASGLALAAEASALKDVPVLVKPMHGNKIEIKAKMKPLTLCSSIPLLGSSWTTSRLVSSQFWNEERERYLE